MIKKMMKHTALAGTLALMGWSVNAQTLEDGIRALDFDKYESARNIFTKLVAAEPVKGVNYFYLGQAYWKLFKADSAALTYNKGIQVDPSNYMNYVGVGELLLDDNKVTEARAFFDKALSFSKGKDGRVKDAAALRLVAEGMVAPEENKLINEAETYINQALELDKKNYDAQVTAGDVFLEKNDGGASASSYERAIDINPNNPKAYTKIANIWLRVKNAEATYSALERALKIDANYAPALKNLAEYYYQTRQFAKAKETYMKYLENSEPSIANKKRFARILFRSKEYEEALVQITDILKVDQSDIFLYRLSGYCAYEVGEAKKDTSKYRPGAADLEIFISKVDPKKIISDDYEHLGKLYSKVPGKDSLAGLYINKAIELDNTKTELLIDAAQIFTRTKNYSEAIRFYDLYFAKTTKNDLLNMVKFGIVCMNYKQLPKADSIFSKVIELKPDYADSYYYKGNIHSQLDQDLKTTTAKENYEKYISFTESTPDKYKAKLINAYAFIRYYSIQKDDTVNSKAYNEKILALDPTNKEALEIQKGLNAPKPKGKK